MTSSYDKTNESAYKYHESVYNRVVDICHPLEEHLGVRYFAYSRFFIDGRLIWHCNQLNFWQYYT